MKEPSWLERVIEYFSKESEELVGEIVLPPVELSTLQIVWGAPPNDPMVDYFSIEKEQAPFFRTLVDVEFDFARYSYFMAAYTTDWAATKRVGGYMGLFPPPREMPGFPEARPVTPKTAS